MSFFWAFLFTTLPARSTGEAVMRTLLEVGRLDHVKGHDVLLEAFALLPDSAS